MSMQKVKVKFQGHSGLAVSWPWRSFEDVPYCFSMSTIKFQSHKAKKLSILTQIGCFQPVTPMWTHQWQQNDAQSLK